MNKLLQDQRADAYREMEDAQAKLQRMTPESIGYHAMRAKAQRAHERHQRLVRATRNEQIIAEGDIP